MRRWISSLAAPACAAVLVLSATAAGKPGRGDLVWQAPDFASYDVRSIALLPAFTFDNNLDARRQTELVAAQSLRGTGYRWVSPLVAREFLSREGGDSLLDAVGHAVLKTGRPDSLDAPRLSRLVRARSILTIRVDRFERLELPYDQSGKPATTVQLTAALVDSTGRLLWSASGQEVAEGPYQDAGTNALGMNASGLDNRPMTNQGGAPGYAETLNRLFTRWLTLFPARAAATTPAASQN